MTHFCVAQWQLIISFRSLRRYWLDLSPDDTHWNISDTGWAKSAYSSFFAPWLQGSCVFVYHRARFEPLAILEALQKYPISTFCSAPTAYRMMVQEDLTKYKFPQLRHCVSAGEPLNPEVIDEWREATGFQIREGYGQSETVSKMETKRVHFRCDTCAVNETERLLAVTAHLCPEMHLALNLVSSYKTDLFVIFILCLTEFFVFY